MLVQASNRRLHEAPTSNGSRPGIRSEPKQWELHWHVERPRRDNLIAQRCQRVEHVPAAKHGGEPIVRSDAAEHHRMAAVVLWPRHATAPHASRWSARSAVRRTHPDTRQFAAAVWSASFPSRELARAPTTDSCRHQNRTSQNRTRFES